MTERPIVFVFIALLVQQVTFAAILDTSVEKKWKNHDSSKDIAAAFGDKMHSFGVHDNWKIYMTKSVFTIPHTKVIKDYTGIISSYLKEAGAVDGAAVKLEKGTYPVSAPIEIPSHTCIVGAGMADTTVKLIDGADAFYEKGLFYSLNGERVSLQGFTIDGNKDKQNKNDKYWHNGVYFELVNYAWFRNVRVQNMFHHGCMFSGSHLFSPAIAFSSFDKASNTYHSVLFHEICSLSRHAWIEGSLGIPPCAGG